MRRNIPISVSSVFSVAFFFLATAVAPAFDDPAATTPAAQPDSKPNLRPIENFDPSQYTLPDVFGDEKWLNDPFGAIEGDMNSAIADLDVGRTHPPAEFTQPQIIDRLDTMIDLLEKACKGSGGGGGQNPSRPAEASTLRTGKDRRGPMRTPQQDGRKWAELTPKEREKILQSQTDGFPAGYDEILADYFRKLSRATPAPAAETNNAK